MKISTIRDKKIRMLLTAVFWIAVWQVLSIIVGNELFLPFPISAAKALAGLLKTGIFYKECGYTILRCLYGMGLSFVTGLLAAFLSYKFIFARDVLSLPISLLKTVPVMAVIIYAVLLLKSDTVPVLICFLMCFPAVYTNVLLGLDNIDKKYIEFADIYNISSSLKFKYIYLPSVFPYIKAALTLIAGLSWKSVVAAEVLSIPKFSMGYKLLNAKIYFETDDLFAWVAAIVVLSICFEKIIKAIVEKFEVKDYERSKIVKCGKPLLSSKYNKLDSENIIIKNLNKRFDNNIVFNDFSIEFKKNEVTVLMSPSGRGKTTILRLISGLDKDYEGYIEGIKGKKISYLFQDTILLPWLNVYDNAAIILKDKIEDSDIDRNLRKIFKELKIEDYINKMPESLSGGMKRRAAMAGALLCPSEILLIDEPFNGLDMNLKESLMKTLFSKETIAIEKTVIVITHSLDEADKLGHRVYNI